MKWFRKTQPETVIIDEPTPATAPLTDPYANLLVRMNENVERDLRWEALKLARKFLRDQHNHASSSEWIAIADDIQHYVETGELSEKVKTAVYNEGLREGRMEVRQALLDSADVREASIEAVFQSQGWL